MSLTSTITQPRPRFGQPDRALASNVVTRMGDTATWLGNAHGSGGGGGTSS
jgi:hypothetical protein